MTDEQQAEFRTAYPDLMASRGLSGNFQAEAIAGDQETRKTANG